MGAAVDERGREGRLGRSFWSLWLATAGSSFGDGLAAVGFPLYAYGLTHSAVAVSAVYAMTRLPALLVAYPAGMLADRMGRRRLAVTADVVRFGLLLGIVLLIELGVMTIGLLCVAVFLVGSFEQVYQAATFSVLPSMIPADDLVKANSRLWVADVTVEDLVGQGVGGFLLAIGRSLPFVVDAASFLWSAILLRSAIPAGSPHGGRGAREEERDAESAVGWFLRRPELRSMALLISSFGFCQAAVLAIIVVYLRRDLDTSAAGVGAVLAVSAIGTIFGAWGATRITARFGAVQALMVGGAVAGAAYLLLGGVRSVVAAGIALALETGATNIGVISSVSLRQRLIPKDLLGRVGMIMRTIIFAGMPLGAIAAGALATVMPLPQVFLLAGVLQLAVLAGWSLDWRRRAPGRPGAHFKRAERVGFEPTVP